MKRLLSEYIDNLGFKVKDAIKIVAEKTGYSQSTVHNVYYGKQ